MSRINPWWFPVMLILSSAAFGALPKDDDSAPDPRLDQKVTLELGNVTLEDICKELSKLTGVTIVAGRGKSDWQVKERRTVIFAKDVTARDVLSRLSKLHHYRLSRSGPAGKWAYVFWQDRRSRDEEQALRDAEAANVEQRIANAAAYYPELAGAASRMTEKELTELEKSDPFKHFLITDPLGQAVCDLASQIPPEVWNGSQNWSLPVDGQNPGLAATGERFLSEFHAFETLMSGVFDQGGAENRSQPPGGPVTKINFRPAEDDMAKLAGLLGELQVTARKDGREYTESVPLIDPNSPFASAAARLVKVVRSGATQEQLRAYGQQIENDLKLSFTTAREEDPLKDDPILEEKVKIEQPQSYASVLRAIYEKTGTLILADSYREDVSALPKGETSVKEIWTALCAFGKRFARDGEWLTVVDRQWYIKRLADIPEAYLARLRSMLDERGLALQDFEQIANDLSDEQIKKNLLRDDRLKVLAAYLQPESISSLRFFGRLTPQEVAAMTGDARLPVEMLDPDVLQLGLKCIRKTLQDIEGKGAFLTGFEVHEEDGLVASAKVVLDIPKEDGESERKYIAVRAVFPAPPKETDAAAPSAAK